MAYAPLNVPFVWEALSVACLNLTKLDLLRCHLNPSSVPGLVLLLSEGCLTSLCIINRNYDDDDETEPLFDEPGGTAFGDALRANKKLKTLDLTSVRLWDHLSAGLSVINGVVGHATLEKLDLSSNKVVVEDRQIVGDVLGRLIAVPSALNNFLLTHCDLTDVGLRPLFHALPGNVNLRELFVFGDNEICTSEFAVEVLEAVRQNTLLKNLGLTTCKFPELGAAAAFVSQRLREQHLQRG